MWVDIEAPMDEESERPWFGYYILPTGMSLKRANNGGETIVR